MPCKICEMTDGQHQEFCPNKFKCPIKNIGDEPNHLFVFGKARCLCGKRPNPDMLIRDI